MQEEPPKFEVVNADSYKRSKGEAIGADEVTRRAIDARETTGYGYFDGTSSGVFPQAGFSESERQEFITKAETAFGRLLRTTVSVPGSSDNQAEFTPEEESSPTD